MKRYLWLSAVTVAAAALSGCGATDTDSAATAPAASPAATPSSAAAGHNSADVMFAQMMIPHHQQAIQMSDIMLAKEGIDPRVTELAERIKAAQAPEIKTMQGWLAAWDSPAPDPGGHDMGGAHGEDMGGGMSGMLNQDELNRLEGAEGSDAAELFLTQMIAHHEGAVQMAGQQARNGSNPEAVALAKAIVEDQKAEIREMEDLLAAL
ncbi:DUF305 domain-containing protein [Arthrobacter mobilis]|uniref:DUF305 domain-containing protein n=1 Tax=Arthrobacter mobilis TaxID=2724944 RepID=A0A7X6K355_9MICC|nr:DUF305 domain-containing protein [Arthrobacter mobilis]NKX53932.1 DUF305 domain-containing protein [Arthrobacter mobilis]